MENEQRWAGMGVWGVRVCKYLIRVRVCARGVCVPLLFVWIAISRSMAARQRRETRFDASRKSHEESRFQETTGEKG